MRFNLRAIVTNLLIVALFASSAVSILPKPATAAPDPATVFASVHRFYNYKQGVHFYTANEDERRTVQNQYTHTYRYEGISNLTYITPQPGTSAVHRFYNYHRGVHFYTSNQAEASNVNATMGHIYRYEGVAYYAFDQAGAGTSAVHRFYNYQIGVHFYTSNQDEATNVNNTLGYMYRYEGVSYQNIATVAYKNCQAVRDAGAAPIYRGQYGYALHLDGDDDGVACETGIQTTQSGAALTEANVIRVVDGDTVDVSINGTTERLRLIGIDTPETVDSSKPIQCYGPEASQNAKNLLTGMSVTLESDAGQGERDKYGRLLRYVHLPDDTNFNEAAIRAGFAHEYTYDTNYLYRPQFVAAQLEAQNNQRGFWSPYTCSGDTTKPVYTAPAPTPTPQPGGNCDPNYSPCVPMSATDLDCGDIRFRVTVIGVDRHNFDSDGNKIGCESYK